MIPKIETKVGKMTRKLIRNRLRLCEISQVTRASHPKSREKKVIKVIHRRLTIYIIRFIIFSGPKVLHNLKL